MKNFNYPTDKRRFVCSQCRKHRMLRPINFVPNNQTMKMKTPSGDIVDLYIDVCTACQLKNYKKYTDDDTKSLEELL